MKEEQSRGTPKSRRRGAFRLRAVLFDFDGTLTVPGILDFAAVRTALNCPPEEPILEFLDNLPDPQERSRGFAVLEGFEKEAATAASPASHAEEAVHRARAAGMKTGIITRSSRISVEGSLRNFPDLGIEDFDVVVTRSDPVRPKPAPDGVRLAAERLGVKTEEIMVVGDHFLDIWAGREAGAVTVLLHDHPEVAGHEEVAFEPDLGGGEPVEPDFALKTLQELDRIIRLGLPLPQGKLPNETLGRYLESLPPLDSSVVLGPAVGEDTAAVTIDPHSPYLVLKSDPITFVTDRPADYLVVINANDIVTSGAEARWLLTTVLVPPQTTTSQVLRLLDDVAQACTRYGIILCGGHTESTDAVTRPVVIGSMVGAVPRDRLLDKRNMRPGDRILLTKHAGLEGTAVLAQELEKTLLARGLSPEDLRTARGLVEQLSVAAEARISADSPGTSALHDVTEGGVATALEELSLAGGHRIRVDLEQISTHPLTRSICTALDVDPLGLIGSGSLLLCCREEQHEELARRIEDAGIPVAVVGEVEEAGRGVAAHWGGAPATWPRFERDEAARILEDGN